MSEGEEIIRTVLDDVKKREICAILAMGGSRAIAAAYVGCHPNTIRKHILRDEAFAQAVEQAESKHEVAQLSYINSAGKEGRHWRAAAWLLEHRYPGRYGRRKTDQFTLEQVTHILTQFAGVILDEIEVEEMRQRILGRLSELATSLRLSAAGENA